MEESGAQPVSPPAPPMPAPKGKTMMYAAIAIVVVIVGVVAVAAVVLMNPSGGGGGNTTAWEPQEGQYMMYSITINGTAFAIERMTVTSVTATTITLNISTTTSGGHTTYQTATVPRAEVAGSGIDINNPPAGYTLVNQGKSSVSTSWGSRSCDHYHVAYSMGTTVTMDIYLYKNILVKMEAESAGTTIAEMLIGTNISVITSG